MAASGWEWTHRYGQPPIIFLTDNFSLILVYHRFTETNVGAEWIADPIPGNIVSATIRIDCGGCSGGSLVVQTADGAHALWFCNCEMVTSFDLVKPTAS